MLEFCNENLQLAQTLLDERNHCLKLADSSPSGWETVNQYLMSPLARDEEDAKKIKAAEKAAADIIKEKQAAKKTSHGDYYKRDNDRKYDKSSQESYTRRSVAQDNKTSDYKPSSFRSLGSYKSLSASATSTVVPDRKNGGRGFCYNCGDKDHYANECPEKRTYRKCEYNR